MQSIDHNEQSLDLKDNGVIYSTKCRWEVPMVLLFTELQEKRKKTYHRKIKAILEYLQKFNSLIVRNIGEAKQVQLLFSLYSLLPLIYSGSKWVNSALQAAMENCEKLLAILIKLSASVLAGEERERLHICCMGANLKHNPNPWQNYVHVMVNVFR